MWFSCVYSLFFGVRVRGRVVERVCFRVRVGEGAPGFH